MSITNTNLSIIYFTSIDIAPYEIIFIKRHETNGLIADSNLFEAAPEQNIFFSSQENTIDNYFLEYLF